MTEQDWAALLRPIPDWFADAKLGIFIHWGAYSVPAWAPPTGMLGELDDHEFFARNPYAEWYGNSMRIEGSPTAQHHTETYGDAPYDDFLDGWRAEQFDAPAMIEVFRAAGARYVIPTTKHHDGITLWDAPGTSGRNTVRRGPGRDLVGEFADATRAAGLHFGVYYSGGLDWFFAPTAPITSQAGMLGTRPSGADYADYAGRQVADLVRRYEPDVLWNDIEWPDAGKLPTANGLLEVLGEYRERVPHGVINDRWGIPLHDFRTSEYSAGLENESGPAWERCRGIGYSFGYNQLEGDAQSLSTREVVMLLADIVSRGGNLLLNVGPTAQGTLPAPQAALLAGLAEWMQGGAAAIHGTRPVADFGAHNSDDPWVRWTAGPDAVNAIVATDEREFVLPSLPVEADPVAHWAGSPVRVTAADDGYRIDLGRTPGTRLPLVISFSRKATA